MSVALLKDRIKLCLMLSWLYPLRVWQARHGFPVDMEELRREIRFAWARLCLSASEPTMSDACETPMRGHVARFWQTLQDGEVRILVDMRRPESFGGLGHWDSASFPDDVAKAIATENESLRAVVADMLSGLAYLRTTNRVPYGFGIDRLEQTGRAALTT